MKNEKGQTPCLVTAWLWTPCYTIEGVWLILSKRRFAYAHQNCQDSFVEALPAGDVYLGQDKADATLCDCNTVTYSMYAACALCQGGDIDP